MVTASRTGVRHLTKKTETKAFTIDIYLKTLTCSEYVCIYQLHIHVSTYTQVDHKRAEKRMNKQREECVKMLTLLDLSCLDDTFLLSST